MAGGEGAWLSNRQGWMRFLDVVRVCGRGPGEGLWEWRKQAEGEVGCKAWCLSVYLPMGDGKCQETVGQ